MKNVVHYFFTVPNICITTEYVNPWYSVLMKISSFVLNNKKILNII